MGFPFPLQGGVPEAKPRGMGVTPRRATSRNPSRRFWTSSPVESGRGPPPRNLSQPGPKALHLHPVADFGVFEDRRLLQCQFFADAFLDRAAVHGQRNR